MKRALRIAGVLFLIALLCALVFGAWWLLLDGRAPAPRPDLVRVPVETVPPAPGYPTLHALYLGYLFNRIKIADIQAHHPAPEGVTVEADQVYASPDNHDLKLDVYHPALLPAKPAPILLFIHGGGWSGGGKHDYEIYCNRFAGLGYVAASMDYRLSKQAKFPAAVQDTNAAIRWLRANASRFGGDSQRIAVIGGSAGGYLALMAGYASDVPELQGDSHAPENSTRVQAVVDLYGPTDLTAPAAQHAPQVTSFLGKQYADAPDLYKLASPIAHLDKHDPPTLIIQGTLDDTVPPAQSDLLAEKLKALGADYWYDRIEGWPHTLDIVLANFEHTSAVIEAFLKANGLSAQ